MTSILEVKGITKKFGGHVAVNDVSFALAEGEILGLIGPNGAGKTTLFNVMVGALKADSGQTDFQGQPITGLPVHQVVALGLARTFQVVKPFGDLSVLENVMVGAFLRHPDTVDAESHAREIIAFTGLEDSIDRPARGLTLAGRKRLELARALATDPTVLLLDEVMAGLTPTESTRIVEVLHRIRESGVSLLIIEHVMAAVMALSDRVAVLHHGELLALGSPQEVTSDQKVIEAYLGKDFGKDLGNA